MDGGLDGSGEKRGSGVTVEATVGLRGRNNNMVREKVRGRLVEEAKVVEAATTPSGNAGKDECLMHN